MPKQQKLTKKKNTSVITNVANSILFRRKKGGKSRGCATCGAK